MSELDRKFDEALDGLDQEKRKILMRLAKGSAFAAPVVTSFLMQGLSLRPAHALAGSSSNTTRSISDVRLKRNVVRIGTHGSGCGLYRFRYLWSETPYIGALAQDVLMHAPHAVTSGPGGFLGVDYAAIGMTLQPA